MKKIFYFIFILAITAQYSCVKEEEVPSPSCSITIRDNRNIPIEEYEFSFDDTIHVYAHASGYSTTHLEISINGQVLTTEVSELHNVYFPLIQKCTVGVNILKITAIDENNKMCSTTEELKVYSNKPSVATNSPVTNLDNSVKLSGKLISSGGKPTKWGICYSRTSLPTKVDNCFIAEDTSFSINVKNEVEINKLYYARAWAENSDGIIYGDQVLFSVHNFGFFVDPRDDKIYKTVNVGGTIWMAENLAWEGDSVHVKKIEHWSEWETSTNGYSYYYNDKDNYGHLGVYYQFDAAQKACPDGWHLPTPIEWDALAQPFGGRDNTGKVLKSYYLWKDDGNGNNEIGFNLLPAGRRDNLGSFSFTQPYIERAGLFWTDQHENNNATINYCLYDSESLSAKTDMYKQNGMSVRCVKDE